MSRLDAEILLAHTLSKPRSYLFAWPEALLDKARGQHFDELVAQRRRGRPIAYLIGYREFWSLRLQISEDVLIPRPETELLVDCALMRLRANPNGRVLDLGTGSGAVALAIASEHPLADICACDVSPQALMLARHNAASLGIGNINFVISDWFGRLPVSRFDVIVGNPPYIAIDDPHLCTGDVAHEPRSALVSGADGLDAIRHITATAPRFLNTGGTLALEHGSGQGHAVSALFQQHGLVEVQTRQDLQGLDRVSLGYTCN